jgi:hypothetical protein
MFIIYFNVFNINFQCIKIQHTNTAILKINVYILNIWLSYTTSVAYKRGKFGFMRHYSGLIPWRLPLQIATRRYIQCDNMNISETILWILLVWCHELLMVMHGKNNVKFKRVYIHVRTRTGSRCTPCVCGLATDLPITITFWNAVWRYLCLRLGFTDMLRSNGWLFVTDVSGKRIGPYLQGQPSAWLPTNVTQHPNVALRQPNRGRSLKSHVVMFVLELGAWCLLVFVIYIMRMFW